MDQSRFAVLNSSYAPNIPDNNNDVVLEGTQTPLSEQADRGAAVNDQPMASPQVAPFDTTMAMPVDGMVDLSTHQLCQNGCDAMLEGVEDAIEHYGSHIVSGGKWRHITKHVLETWGGDDGDKIVRGLQVRGFRHQPRVLNQAEREGKQLLDELARTLEQEGRQAIFTCGGRIPIVTNPNLDESGNLTPRTAGKVKNQKMMTKPITVRWGDDGSGRKLTLPVSNTLERHSLQDLVDACLPATFGRNGKDVYDENCRRAGALDTGRFMTDFCPYEHGIIDVITQLLLPPIVGELKTPKPIPVQVSRETRAEEQWRIFKTAKRLSVREHGMSTLMVHAENVWKCMERLEVPIMSSEALHQQLENMMVMSAITSSRFGPQPFTDHLTVGQVVDIATKKIEDKRQRRQEALDSAKQESNTHRALRRRGIRAELYKLNVYSGPCGMFKAHVDTPRSQDQVGSLVVALPVNFAGGALAVRQQGQEVLHDWSTSTDDAPCIQWAAFYSDCEHEVQEVTSGNRLTLTYNLFVSAGTGLLNGAALSLSADRLPLFGQLRRMLETSSFMTDGGYLGLYLGHSYPHTNDKMHRFVPNMLKGADMATYEAFAALGLACVLAPKSSLTGAECLRDLDTMHRSRLTTSNPSMSLLMDMSIEPDYDESDVDSDDVGTDDDLDGDDYDSDDPGEQYDNNGRVLGEKGREIREGKQAWKKVVWLNEAVHQELSKVYMAYGNQAEMKVSYSSVALVVKVPSWQERNGAGDAAAEPLAVDDE